MPVDVARLGPQESADRLTRLVWLAAIVLIVFGVKLLFIRQFGSAVPYWDQWDAEADLIYKPYLNSSLSLENLFQSHNEHRIFISRILTLILFEIDGGWDPILQMAVNAGLHVIAIVILVLALRPIIRPDQFGLLVLFSTLLFALPIGWENLLAGFQSQFYFLLMFSLLALKGFAGAPAFSLVWWGSALCAVAAYFSMASGALTAAAAVALVGAQFVLRHRTGRKELVGIVVLVAMTAVMLAFIRIVPQHDVIKAHSFSEFARAFLALLSFPRVSPILGLWVNLPAAVYVCAVLLRRPGLGSPHWYVLGFIIWLLAQSLSLAYGRAAFATSPRYLDLIVVGLPINFAILLLASNWMVHRRARAVTMLAMVGWLCIVFSGLIWNTVVLSLPAVLGKGQLGREQQQHVLAYLQTGKLAELQGKAEQAVPYPVPERLAELLSDPTIRQALPDAIRPADIDDRARLDRTLMKGRLRGTTNWLKLQMLNNAEILAGGGVALGFAAGWIGLMRRRGSIGDVVTPRPPRTSEFDRLGRTG
ncbi:hypothetical protein [Rhodopseudomonas palustris]|uniref:Glycosyltransferase RgtA/B/C/D-like domain-containing protein n=1 Tax=Rhodopseudomonas palustris TaxID=1076 RepID=A0A418V3Z0_RHOPL|nr:hypothetical protein [Rhodopseudomonas palustris]RJF70786.1 hypothetical protein D4Q52_15835 [Rhodopseudomonas palustris]